MGDGVLKRVRSNSLRRMRRGQAKAYPTKARLVT